MALKGPKSILYIVMLYIKSKVMKSRITVVQNFCSRGMSGGHQRSKNRILGPFILIVTQLLGFF